MKKGQLHLGSVGNGGSKVLSERSQGGLKRETNVTVWGKPRFEKSESLPKNISAVTTDSCGWMLVADPKENNLICLDDEGVVRGYCVMKDGKTDIDLENVGELKYNSESNVLVIIKNSGVSAQIGAFVLNTIDPRSKNEKNHNFKDFLVDSKNNTESFMTGDCKFWIGSSPYLDMPLDASYIDESQLLFVADASRNECLCFNMSSKQIKKLSYPGAARPNSTFHQRNEIFVKDDQGIHKFSIVEDDKGNATVTYAEKTVSIADSSCLGMSGLTDDQGNVYLLTISAKEKLVYAIDTQHQVMTKIHFPIPSVRSTQRLISCRPSLPNNNSPDFTLYISNIAENRIIRSKVGFENMNFIKNSAVVESDFFIAGNVKKINKNDKLTNTNVGKQAYPMFNQMAGICFDNDNKLFTSDSRDRALYKFDENYRFEGRVNVIDSNGEKANIRFGGLEYSPRYILVKVLVKIWVEHSWMDCYFFP